MKRIFYPEPISALELFQPTHETIYSIEEAARLAQVPRRLIAVYFRHGLVSPATDPDIGGWYFNDEGIRTLRQIERLRNSLGMSLMAVKVVLELGHEVERLRQEVRFLRRL
jgi:DNA-binding transcriptional MerR regulator